MVSIQVNFGVKVRELRQKKCMSQEYFADLCGLHRTYISDVELGKRNISIENIQKVALALEISISDLFYEVEKNETI
ncbi:helix-turn-helix domain-containing protein [Streptococcus koreensis]|uniref:XRE family transcriptional regulator n=1 Tax=Streptococcus koreensis TaxID=2382163 RepID=A0ABN5PUB2_9STRE|nr:helix-turn-helix transcriptional regulator [Streptococcus koreensis]AYF93860.1 XRE family transcriptional regulator [Streptococcus koreensis]